MNYQKIYEQLTAKDMIADYTEEHHIIPDCFFINRKRKGPKGHLEGNPDDPSNLVRLTPEAHYVAHQLLVKIYPTHHGLIKGAQMMTVDSNSRRVNNKLYGWIRRKLIETMKGKPKSDETRAKMSAAKRQMTAETRAKISAAGKLKPPVSNETRAKMSAAGKLKPPVSANTRTKRSNSMRGKSRSAETRAKISLANKGKSPSAESIAKSAASRKGKSRGAMLAETRAKISAANKDKSHSAEARAKISLANKGKPKPTTICPHCNKAGGGPVMQRYHFDKCKSKPLSLGSVLYVC